MKLDYWFPHPLRGAGVCLSVVWWPQTLEASLPSANFLLLLRSEDLAERFGHETDQRIEIKSMSNRHNREAGIKNGKEHADRLSVLRKKAGD
ncbi:MAG: hypothetical protein JWQ71_3878 [Pedosphaera sp.]|nr:hypothetical protein [Pedosphaera sp.]